MSDMEKRMRDAFDEVHVPERVKSATLAAIEEKRREETPSCTRSSLKKRRTGTFSSMRAKIALAACAALFVFGIGGAVYAFATPTAYVGIDVNPSIELGVNRFDRVISAEALNNDGASVLDEVSVEGTSYEQAMKAISDACVNAGYVDDASTVVITVMCDDDRQCSNLENTGRACFGSNGRQVYCARASSDECRSAHEAGLGMGKYKIWSALNEAGVDLTSEEAASMTVAELRALAEQEGVDLESLMDPGNGSCNGNGTASGASASEGTNGQGSGSQSGGKHSGSQGANGQGSGS